MRQPFPLPHFEYFEHCFTSTLFPTDVNHKPRADAGGDVVYQLPQTLLIVDGSRSTDDHGIVDFLWTRDPQSPAAGVGGNHGVFERNLRLSQGSI